ncbi:hypothetical protein ACWGI8_18575 [Streptomyces sp. NPDC054841]
MIRTTPPDAVPGPGEPPERRCPAVFHDAHDEAETVGAALAARLGIPLYVGERR